MKRNILIIAIITIIAIGYLLIAQISGGRRENKHFHDFFSSTINGHIEYTKGGYYGSVFKIMEKGTEYVFYPYTGAINENNIFHYFAEEGDSVYKPALSDTLQLMKNGKVYKYTFQKFE